MNGGTPTTIDEIDFETLNSGAEGYVDSRRRRRTKAMTILFY